jgi:hypothetical protein
MHPNGRKPVERSASLSTSFDGRCISVPSALFFVLSQEMKNGGVLTIFHASSGKHIYFPPSRYFHFWEPRMFVHGCILAFTPALLIQLIPERHPCYAGVDSADSVRVVRFGGDQFRGAARSAPIARTGILRARHPGLGNACHRVIFLRRMVIATRKICFVKCCWRDSDVVWSGAGLVLYALLKVTVTHCALLDAMVERTGFDTMNRLVAGQIMIYLVVFASFRIAAWVSNGLTNFWACVVIIATYSPRIAHSALHSCYIFAGRNEIRRMEWFIQRNLLLRGILAICSVDRCGLIPRAGYIARLFTNAESLEEFTENRRARAAYSGAGAMKRSGCGAG